MRRGLRSLVALGAVLACVVLACVVLACVVLACVVLAFAASGFAAAEVPVAARAAALRWREIHTPKSGRERVLAPEVLALVAALESAGARTFRFTPSLANDVAVAPFLLEASRHPAGDDEQRRGAAQVSD